MKAKVQRVSFEPNRRILAVSDIHGNLPWFKALLEKAEYGPDDILVLLGDYAEKGPESLATLRYVMELAERENVYCVTGNCDTLVLDLGWGGGSGIMGYLGCHPESLVFQMIAEGGFDFGGEADLPRLRDFLFERFPREMAFLAETPTILETEHYVFVHGGVPSYEHMEKLNAWKCMKNDNFLGQGHSFPKYCVVGHWPTTLYREGIPSCDPLIERARKIASIDGGCCIKVGGQLNALVIPRDGSEEFSFIRYDDYPVCTAVDAQEESGDVVSIRWSDNQVEILERGEEFSLCRHKSTGRTLWVLTRYLFQWGETDCCEDATDYRLGTEPGDALSVVEETSKGYLAKKDGQLGWYRGRLQSV
ncbi:MAG: serine/threonine protein phosphatase [Clostridia bacterium]|nr:serine/threonine protein phosphatase [Clostridia bacterium]